MRSDVIHVTNEGDGIDEALEQTEKVAVFKGLESKNALHLRLLTEEMMGMMRALTGEREADFWIEDDGGDFELHLRAETRMTGELRKKLLSASTSGKNDSAKGVLGKLRDLFERAIEPIDDGLPLFYTAGLEHSGADLGALTVEAAGMWSLNAYRASVEKDKAPKEEWDELEKSVIANIADEVNIGIADNNVEMTVFKKF